MNGVDALRVLFAPLVTIQVFSPLDFSTPAATPSVPSRKTARRRRRREVLNSYPITYPFDQISPPLISLEFDKK